MQELCDVQIHFDSEALWIMNIALGMMMVAACFGGNTSNFMMHLAKGNTTFLVSLKALATFRFAIALTLMPIYWSQKELKL